MEKIYNISLDTKRQAGYPRIEFVHGDISSNRLVIKLYQDKVLIDLTGKTVTLTIRKPDNTIIVYDITAISTSEVQFIPDTNALAAVGTVLCSIEIYEGVQRITTAKFQYFVLEELNSKNDIPSFDDYPILTKLINDVQTLQANTETLAETANTSADNADAKALLAQTAADNANTEAALAQSKADEVTARMAELEQVDAVQFDGRITTAEQNIEANKASLADNTSNINDLKNKVGNGSPEAFATLTALQTAYPTGATGSKVVIADGKWYYWNGSTWTVGGVYQSTGIADDTVKIRKLPSKVITSISHRQELRPSWEMGNISGVDGSNIAATTRIRTIDFITPDDELEITLLDTTKYKYIVFIYNTLGTFISNSAWINYEKQYLYKGYKYKIIMANQDDSIISDVSIPSNDIFINKRFKRNSVEINSVEPLTASILSSYTGIEKIYNYDWAGGGISSGGVPSIFMSLQYCTRLITISINKADKDITIVNSDPTLYKYSVYYYDELNNFINATSWLYDGGYIIPNGSNYRLMIAYKDDKAMSEYTEFNLYNKFAFLGGTICKISSNMARTLDKTGENMINTFTDYASFYDVSWKRGNIQVGVGITVSDSINSRILTPDLYFADEDIIVINVDSSKYKFGIFYYDESGTVNEDYAVWLDYDKYIITRGKYFRMIMAYSNDAVISTITSFSKNIILLKASGKLNRDIDYVPSYWARHLNSKINTVKGLQLSDGNNKFSFAVIGDIHWAGNYQKSPGLVKKIIQNCNINHIIAPGDISTDGVTKDVAIKNMREVVGKFTSLGGLFMPVMGNHDDNSPSTDSTLNLKTDRTIIKGEQYSLAFRHLANNVVYGETGLYYYIDDYFHKIRFIALDVMDMSYADDGSGKLAYWSFGYRQEQLNWLCNKALNVPNSEWSIVPFTHIPPFTDAEMIGTGSPAPYNSDVLMNILLAFKTKNAYTINVSNNGDYNITINVDFTDKGGNVIALICGHCHYDQMVYWQSSIPVITVLDDAYHQVGDAPLKTKGTITEQAFDIFTIDKTNKKIYATRIGAGADREYTY